MEHISVLLKESIELLNISDDKTYVDATMGRAGHSSEILKKLKSGHLYCFDQDHEAIKFSQDRLQKINNNFSIINDNFVNIKAQLALNNVTKIDGILYDLGVSSPQFDQADRGFSYRLDARLDMRMNQNQELDAHKVINKYSEEELVDMFYKYGEEKFSRSIAKNIVKERKSKEINTTLELVEIIKNSVPKKILYDKKHPARKVFQALRIYVNNELKVFENSLTSALSMLNPGGRIVVITFHSLEEKIVKSIFKDKTLDIKDEFFKKLPVVVENKKDYKLVIRKPIQASLEELELNKRSRSARLWAIERN
ncbi:16S rRNA (cytosine(1402)-N(4))-methyltransferase RsmH [Spiroplasma endosymbiont of Othius punctulatus]|uniref:16S rRNA (cytosine(1402)-N(4))-methyltransferase RsmH n=1 Tax=Spiroplasma endosymbiont of Othius punctulatus TaxID=3066289 RepID=UPI0030D06909